MRHAALGDPEPTEEQKKDQRWPWKVWAEGVPGSMNPSLLRLTPEY